MCILIHLFNVKAGKVVNLNDCNGYFQSKHFATAKECLDELISKSASKTEIERARFLRANVNLQLNEPILSLHDLQDVPVDNQDVVLFKAKLYILIGNFKMASAVIGDGNSSEAKKLLKSIAEIQRKFEELLSRKESSSPEVIIKLSNEILLESKYHPEILMLKADSLIKLRRFTDALLTLQYGLNVFLSL